MSGGKYDDMIHLPHYQSKKRPHMSNLQRAAQFSSFAALKGFDEEIAETARYTESEIELTEERKNELGEGLATLKRGQNVTVTYFLPDEKKAGGAYLTKSGTLKKADDVAEILVFTDGTTVPFDMILDLF